MSIVTTDSAHYAAIAGAIRRQLGVQTTYKPEDMAAAIASISGGGDVLPDEYQQVEYLQNDSSGNAYVRVPVVLLPGNVFSYSAERDTWPAESVFVGIKTSIDQGQYYRVALGLTNNKKRLFGGVNNAICATENPEVTAGSSIVTYGDTISSGKYQQSITIISSPSSGNYFLFYGRYATIIKCDSVKLFPATMTRNGIIVLNLRPCKRIADDVCGFFDTIQQLFYTASDGIFTAGPDVT